MSRWASRVFPSVSGVSMRTSAAAHGQASPHLREVANPDCEPCSQVLGYEGGQPREHACRDMYIGPSLRGALAVHPHL